MDSNNILSNSYLRPCGRLKSLMSAKKVVSIVCISLSFSELQSYPHSLCLLPFLFFRIEQPWTQTQYDADPRSSRPHAGVLPSAEEAKAAIYQKQFFSGFTVEQKINTLWKNNTSIYGSYSTLKNPTFLRYSIGDGSAIGGRTNFQFVKNFNKAEISVDFGAEYQKGFGGGIKSYQNNNGYPGVLQSDDEINNAQKFIYLQGNLKTGSNWVLTIGASINKSNVEFLRYSTIPNEFEKRNFRNEMAPRFALLKKVNNTFSIYGSIARGFSPPATSEILPTSRIFNAVLEAEKGIDKEIGIKGDFKKHKLFFDINAFHYKLKNAIVQKQDNSGAIFYDNAGSTKQIGLETYISYVILDKPISFFDYGFVYLSDTWNNFRYDVYKQIINAYSGNKMTGVPSQTVSAGLDLSTKLGIYTNLTYFFSGRIPLNDANTSFAKPYNLLGMKLGYKKYLSKNMRLELFVGAQNIINEKYSLGNDINAAAGRYYNAAAGRNYFVGIGINFVND